MRGQHLLFNDIFTTTTSIAEKKPGKGRNTDLIAARNECLVYRYYYYATFFKHQLMYEYIIQKVAAEFWLSPVTVPEIIEDNFTTLAHVKKEQPTLKVLAQKFPHICWRPD